MVGQLPNIISQYNLNTGIVLQAMPEKGKQKMAKRSPKKQDTHRKNKRERERERRRRECQPWDRLIGKGRIEKSHQSETSCNSHLRPCWCNDAKFFFTTVLLVQASKKSRKFDVKPLFLRNDWSVKPIRPSSETLKSGS